MNDLGQDFQDLIALLTSHDVEFIIVGASAVAFLGHTRYTEDIDVWIRRVEENANRTAERTSETLRFCAKLSRTYFQATPNSVGDGP